MFVGEAPGRMEDAAGYPFVERAPAGTEFTDLLNRNGMPRCSVYISNICRCWPGRGKSGGDRDPAPEEIANCGIWLDMDIAAADPRFIIAMGRIATRRFLGDVDMSDVHGLPYPLADGRIVIPVYHPAAGLHNPALMLLVHADFRAVKEIISGKRPIRRVEDTWAGKEDYTAGASSIPAYLKESTLVAVDTETKAGKFWCLSFSVSPGTARVIMHDQPETLSILARHLASPAVLTLFHNYLFDGPVLDQAGIRPARVVDSMIAAYLLQSEAQGLKSLAYRYCNMTMISYTDMVAPATRSKAMEYLAIASMLPFPAPEHVFLWVKGKPHVKKPQSITKKILRILKDAETKDANPRQRWLNIDVEEGRGMVEDAIGEMPAGDLSDIDRAAAIRYSARDADATLRVWPVLWDMIVAAGLEDAFAADMAVIPMVSDMMIKGIRIDPQHFRDLSAYLQGKADAVLDELLRKLRGMGVALDYFNPASPPQVGALLYDKDKLDLSGLGIKGGGGGRGGTDNKILSRLSEMPAAIGEKKVEVIRLVQDYRSYVKLNGTYARPIPQMADAANRLHTTFRITRTSTGRLSSSSPNLMAQPVRSEEGKRVRDGYMAEDGCLLVSADYSQIELRVLAHASQDSRMLSIFREGLDLHKKTAADAFGVPMSELKDWQRRCAKTLNFGIAYGMQSEGLRSTLATMGINWTARQCDDFRKEYFRLFPGVRTFMDATHDHAKRYGWVEDIFGRRRWIPGAKSGNKWLREEALREAGNHPIQSGAQGIIKRAMGELVPVYREWQRQGVVFQPLIQIHDSLEFECSTEYLETLVPLLLHIMETAVKLSIPVKVDAKVGRRWGSMQAYPGTA